jgi:hypothetical protein
MLNKLINAIRVGISTIHIMKAERRMVPVMAAHKRSRREHAGYRAQRHLW